MEQLEHLTGLHLHYPNHDPRKPILALQNVSVRYNSTVALENITFQLQVGERVAVIGPNGAGKSTLFNVISGVLPPNRGQVDVAGHGPSDHIWASAATRTPWPC